MKNILIYCVIVLGFQLYSPIVYAQRYLQGGGFVMYTEVIHSDILNEAKRLSIEEAYSLFSRADNQRIANFYKSEEELNGEFFLKDGLIINVLSKKFDKAHVGLSERLFSDMKKGFDSNYKKNEWPYYSAIRSIRDFQVLVSYDKIFNIKRFFAIDNNGKYYLTVNIYGKQESGEIAKAEALVDTLVNDITFK